MAIRNLFSYNAKPTLLYERNMFKLKIHENWCNFHLHSTSVLPVDNSKGAFGIAFCTWSIWMRVFCTSLIRLPLPRVPSDSSIHAYIILLLVVFVRVVTYSYIILFHFKYNHFNCKILNYFYFIIVLGSKRRSFVFFFLVTLLLLSLYCKTMVQNI